ncbi:PTS sugar transporter subunit IIB [Sporolactobacillus shoreicorticis]|uniref:PTS sugar transporter subunit IIB n=1 Tax=Sporolactobacillus shoreicorticis TaxID=1923877 RepID=A0ABW5S1L9_9BACL|nr:PTS sugar transporter subunit IIB [Sporolactobacillus shoreicorticis]MCO7124491.1 PTS sugar transporter subunit IIB [Sporolactobacillus shoreicorticis]
MKKILVACGAGVVTSTIAVNKVDEGLKSLGIAPDQYKIDQTSIAQVASLAEGYDLVITTAQYTNDIGVPVLNGLPFLTNIGADELIKKIAQTLELAQ